MEPATRGAAVIALLLAFAVSSCTSTDSKTTATANAAAGWNETYAEAIEAYERADYVEASRLARVAHTRAEAAIGPDTAEAGAALSLRAAAELALGHYPEATAAFEASLATLRRTPDADPKDMSAAMGNLGELYRQQGEIDRARPWYEEVYRINRSAYGDAHVETATALAALALIRHESGDLPEAEQAYTEALTGLAAAGAPPLQQANVRMNLADLLVRTDRTEEARLMLEDVLAVERAHYPPGHPGLAYTLNTLGTLADAQGRHEDALELYRQALDIRLEALPAGHPAIATVLANMAGTYRDLGATAEARAVYAQAFEILREAHGDDHPDTAALEAALRSLD